MTTPSRPDPKTRGVWAILWLAAKNFFRIDGTQWAGAFAFNAFLSLFPLMILLVTVASSFVDQDRAGTEVIAYMQGYVPISGAMQRYVFDTISGVIKARQQVSVIALLILVWVALQCFITLIIATNRAWGLAVNNWWRLPLKSLVLLGITAGAVFLGMGAAVLMRMATSWLFMESDFRLWAYTLVSVVIPMLVMFLGLSLFYQLAPRRPTRFAEVWVAALCATALLQAAQSLFVYYLKNFATLNAIYGVFGGIIAVLLWIYLSGCIFIFGACLCAAQAEDRSAPV